MFESLKQYTIMRNYIIHNLRKSLILQPIQILTLTGVFCMASIAQAQTIGVGVWSPSNASTTLHDVGVGTLSPQGKQEIVYCPRVHPQNGLVVTAKDCAPGQVNVGNIGPEGIFGGATVVGIDGSPILSAPPFFLNALH